MTTLKNSTKLKDTGSMMNLLMGNNNSIPVVGKGATICLYSDRHAYQVMKVSANGKHIIMQACNAKRTDSNGMSESQTYDYSELSGRDEEYVYRQGAWRCVINQIVYEKSFLNYLNKESSETRTELSESVWDKKSGCLILEPGKTRIRTTYNKINVLFGVQREYYDFTR